MREMESIKQPITVTLADAVEKKIYEYIKQNNLEFGAMLPKEEEFAKALNVSRHILREALSRFRMLGLVESRKKKGMTIAQPNVFIGLERIVSAGLVDEMLKKELIELRVFIEIGIADFIAYKKTDGDILELEDIISKEKTKKLTLWEQSEIDVAFHSKLYEISGNRTAMHFQKILKYFFKEIRKDIEEYKGGTPPTHWEICQVLKNGTVEEFRKIMHTHLMHYIQKDIYI